MRRSTFLRRKTTKVAGWRGGRVNGWQGRRGARSGGLIQRAPARLASPFGETPAFPPACESALRRGDGREREVKMSVAPVAHRGDTGGRRGPDLSGHEDPALPRSSSSDWQASAGRGGEYARTGAGLYLTPGRPRPWERQPAWPGPDPAHWLSSRWMGSRWR